MLRRWDVQVLGRYTFRLQEEATALLDCCFPQASDEGAPTIKSETMRVYSLGTDTVYMYRRKKGFKG